MNILTIRYFNEQQTQMVVMCDCGTNRLFESTYRNDMITEWLLTHEIEAWADPIDYMELLRNVRNDKLLNSDWTQLEDAPLTVEQREAWATYRQALRDFPGEHTVTTKAEYEALVWPQEP